MSYEVRLRSWNCTCAAFAFGAFAGEGEDEGLDFRRVGIGPWEEDDDRSPIREIYNGLSLSQLWEDKDPEVEVFDVETGLKAWKFGGLTRGEKVPMCKHLLACILVERVEDLRQYVEERNVMREELAGWAAGWGG